MLLMLLLLLLQQQAMSAVERVRNTCSHIGALETVACGACTAAR